MYFKDIKPMLIESAIPTNVRYPAAEATWAAVKQLYVEPLHQEALADVFGLELQANYGDFDRMIHIYQNLPEHVQNAWGNYFAVPRDEAQEDFCYKVVNIPYIPSKLPGTMTINEFMGSDLTGLEDDSSVKTLIDSFDYTMMTDQDDDNRILSAETDDDELTEVITDRDYSTDEDYSTEEAADINPRPGLRG